MDYVNPQEVRFKICHGVTDRYTVKYYTGVSQWPRILRSFHCPTDVARHEMFFMLGQIRLCQTCKTETLGYIDDPSRMNCQACILKEMSAAGVDGSTLPECPVCYQKMLSVDGSKRRLACRHELCASCTHRLAKRSGHVYYGQHGPYASLTVTCPLCRDVAYYDAAFRVVIPNTSV